MGTHAGVIHLNGKAYDAKTGRQLPPAPASPPKKHHAAKAPSARSVDGFFRGKTSVHKPAPTAKLTKQAQPHAKPATTRSGIKHTLHHKQQKSQTLMRHSVQKPVTSQPLKAHHVAAKAGHATPKAAAKPADPRLSRALSTPKSSLISRFGASHKSKVHKQHQPLPVQPAPAQPSPASVAKPAATPQASPAESAAETHFKQALAKADAHTHGTSGNSKRHTKRKKVARHLGMSARALNATAIVAAILLLAGFFTYQNIPNLSMRIASSRAGFDAKLPAYEPSGYALGGPIEYAPGQIKVSYQSHSDERQYAISQQVSGWNSEALADNYLAEQGKTYQTYQDKGRTIYLYDGANATWVSGGIWYEVNGNDVLNNDQLIRIANSL